LQEDIWWWALIFGAAQERARQIEQLYSLNATHWDFNHKVMQQA
jgi:hypothetical protein